MMEKSIQNIRFLGLDMIDKANSGHPGIVLGAAPVLYSLYQYHLVASATKPEWFNRDRFFLAAGHGSALIYATLHLAGYDIPIEELKRFRQLGSMTPGHPEYGHTPGVEATTGPLGQGVGMAVGSAIAESYLRATFNKNDLKVVDHYTYVLCGDGDLQEGVSMEALSLAGHLNLERLIVLFDSNDIQLDGPTKNAVSENIRMKMESVGFNYELVEDASDVLAVSIAIERAKQTNKPSFIEIKSVIGAGSSKAGTSSVHGAPVGEEETLRMKKLANYPLDPFYVDKDALKDFQNRFGKRGDMAIQTWDFYMSEYEKQYPDQYRQLTNIIEKNIDLDLSDFMKEDPIGHIEATRNTIGKILPKLQEKLPEMIGGSADLTGSTKVKGINGNFTKDDRLGRNINFGVREHAMAAIVNGMTLHNLKAFSGGFFIFSDYMKPAIRIAALMSVPSMFFFTHDSVGVGEDGPTHEPIEQLSMFRTTPNLVTIRPANSNETRYAVRYALESKNKPTVVAMTRQNVTVMHESSYDLFSQGAYVASDVEGFEGIIIATGSEVELAIKAQKNLLEKHGVKVRVVSMPSMEIFLTQPETVRESVLPSKVERRLALEMGSTGLWYRFASNVLGIDTFGVSANLEDVLTHFGFTVENVVNTYLKIRNKA
ncbi:MAG: transketolase [Bacilli bacterium]|nr:transketolase [Bacilli bacterium]